MFRLMTVNLLHDRCDVSHFADVLDELSPDVVVTQELGPLCADILASAYPNHRLRPALDFTGRGIAARLEASFAEIDMPGRPGTAVELSVDGSTLHLGGVHFLNPVVFPWWSSARERGRQFEGLEEWLGSLDVGPVVVAGDFNASPRWPVYRETARLLDDLVLDWAKREGRRPERTWAWRPGMPRLLRIDHVFGRGIEARQVAVRPVAGTDHASVVVDLELKLPR